MITKCIQKERTTIIYNALKKTTWRGFVAKVDFVSKVRFLSLKSEL